MKVELAYCRLGVQDSGIRLRTLFKEPLLAFIRAGSLRYLSQFPRGKTEYLLCSTRFYKGDSIVSQRYGSPCPKRYWGYFTSSPLRVTES